MLMRTVRLALLILLTMPLGCGGPDYRFERIEAGEPVEMSLKFASLRGMRDGETVSAEAFFTDDPEVKPDSQSVLMRFEVHLGPPAEFTSGTYSATIGGQTTRGTVESESLTYLGGQSAVPSVGGVFVLNNAAGQPVYRIRIPATPVERP